MEVIIIGKQISFKKKNQIVKHAIKKFQRMWVNAHGKMHNKKLRKPFKNKKIKIRKSNSLRTWKKTYHL